MSSSTIVYLNTQYLILQKKQKKIKIRLTFKNVGSAPAMNMKPTVVKIAMDQITCATTTTGCLKKQERAV